MEKTSQPAHIRMCGVCEDVLIEAVSLNCCGSTYCSNCWKIASCANRQTCPSCKAQNPSAEPAATTSAIICPVRQCQMNIACLEYPTHASQTCQQLCVRCHFCWNYMSAGKYLDHCSEKHSEELIRLLIEELPGLDYTLHQLNSSYQMGGVTTELAPTYTNDRGFASKFGTTGKLYCGQSLEVGCGCDGYCGPDNGCSCLSCMRLNLKVRGALSSRCLINNTGVLCKISQSNVPYCGIRLSHNSDQYCRTQRQCSDCASLLRHRMMDKYASLLA